MFATEKVFLSLPLFRHDQLIGTTSPRVLHDYKRSHGRHGHRISQWNDDVQLENCFGFIAGMVRPIARPNRHERIVYNGHKRVHLLKFQSVALPWAY